MPARAYGASERWLLTLFVAVICLAPLPLGGNRPFAWSLLAICIGGLLIVWSTAALLTRRQACLRARHSLPLAIPLLLFTAWILLQSTGWTPAGWHHPTWEAAAIALERPLTGAIGAAPDEGLTTLMRLLSYAGSFWLALHLARHAPFARILLWAVALAVTLNATYGLLVTLGGHRQILWLEKWAYLDSVTGTFVNRNSFATYAGLGIVTSLTLFLERIADSAPRGLPPLAALVRFFNSLGLGAWLLLAMLAISGTALLLSGSRGGLAAVGFSVLVLLVASRPRRSEGRRLWIGFVSLTVAGTMVLLAVSGDLLAGRMADHMEDGAGRLAVLDLGRDAIRAAPLAGHGLGSFPGLSFLFDDGTFGQAPLPLRRAHNTYLEVAVESGLPAFLLLQALLAALTLRCLLGVRRRRRDRLYPLAGLATTALVALHSLIDFSLQMSAVSLTYFAIMGAAVAQSWPSARRGRPGAWDER